jgi:hypothetical protein
LNLVGEHLCVRFLFANSINRKAEEIKYLSEEVVMIAVVTIWFEENAVLLAC